MTQPTLLPLVYQAAAEEALDHIVRIFMSGEATGDVGLSTWPHLAERDPATGAYLGPAALMPYLAEHEANYLWTQDVLDVFGEDYCRRILGNRVLNGVSEGLYSKLLQDNWGQPRCLELIAELQGVGISYDVGRFTKGDPVTDQSQWVLVAQSTSNLAPSGIDILLNSASGIQITLAQFAYLDTVIRRYIPIYLPDVRISVVYSQSSTIHPWTAYYSETVYETVDLT